jgi:hypothetical protein
MMNASQLRPMHRLIKGLLRHASDNAEAPIINEEAGKPEYFSQAEWEYLCFAWKEVLEEDGQVDL